MPQSPGDGCATASALATRRAVPLHDLHTYASWLGPAPTSEALAAPRAVLLHDLLQALGQGVRQQGGDGVAQLRGSSRALGVACGGRGGWRLERSKCFFGGGGGGPARWPAALPIPPTATGRCATAPAVNSLAASFPRSTLRTCKPPLPPAAILRALMQWRKASNTKSVASSAVITLQPPQSARALHYDHADGILVHPNVS